MARRLEVEIVGDASSYQRAVNSATRSTQTFGSRLSSLGKNAALAAGGAGVAALTVAVRAGVGELIEHAKVAAQTAQVLKTTGGAANVTAKDVENLANSIMRKTGIDDEAVQTSENLLLGFTKIRNEVGKGNDIFNRATMIVQDYAVRTGRNATSASIIFGKALNDPIKGMSALSRVGITFTQGQKDQIKAMVEAGNVMGAQKLILAELETRFGGAATAAGQTLPGQLNILRESFKNLAAQGLQLAFTKFQELRPAIETIIGVIGSFMGVLAPLATLIFDVLVTPMKVVADLLRGDWTSAWNDAKQPVLDLVNVAKGAWDELKTAATTVWDAIDSKVTGVWNGLQTLTTTVWDGIKTGLDTTWNALSTAATTVWDAINLKVTTVWNGIQTLTTTVWDGIKTALTTTWNGLSTLASTVWDAINTKVTTVWNGLKTLSTTTWNGIKTTVTTVWNGLKTLSTTTWNAIETAIKTPINAAKTAVSTAVGGIKTAINTFTDLKNTVVREWNAIKTAITTPINAASKAVSSAVKAIKGVLNDGIAALNIFIDGLNAFHIPGFNIHIPGVSIAGHTIIPDTNFGWGGYDPFNIPHLPKLGEGGIVTGPTLAMIGEKGPEAVVPLGRHGPGGAGLTVNVTVMGSVTSERDLHDSIHRELVRRLGRNYTLGFA